ncbi:MAG: hypothetical protein SF339_20095 [Blastocatellia bacterium]|nr:hypothetical protein [Blastocatellia bacterium]
MILLIGAIAPALRTLAPEPLTCGMACCEESGVCCCLMRKGEDSPAGHHHDEEPAVTATVMTQGCMPNCGLAPSPFPGVDSRADRPGGELALRRVLLPSPMERAPRAPSSIAFASCSPRAPPALNLPSFA